MDTALFLSTFALIFVAELPDKTAFAILLMATKGNPFALFSGIAVAFTIQSAVAVLFGSALTLLPPRVVHIAAALLFLLFAALMWLRKDPPEEERAKAAKPESFLKTAWTAFLVIFIAEWGDLTQFATATLVAKYHSPFTLFVASTLALWTSSALAIIVGNRMKHMIHPPLLRRIAAFAFLAVALWMFISEARAGC